MKKNIGLSLLLAAGTVSLGVLSYQILKKTMKTRQSYTSTLNKTYSDLFNEFRHVRLSPPFFNTNGNKNNAILSILSKNNLTHCLEYLSISDLIIIQRVNKDWISLITDDYLSSLSFMVENLIFKEKELSTKEHKKLWNYFLNVYYLKNNIRFEVESSIYGSSSGILKEYQTSSFEQLVNKGYSTLSSSMISSIQKDTNRTFPDRDLFRTEKMRNNLADILIAYSYIDPLVGYVQGTNFIVGFLLSLYNPSQSFWVFFSLMHNPRLLLRSCFLKNMPQIHSVLSEFQDIFSRNLSELECHLTSLGLKVHLFALHWFLTLFVSSLPFDSVYRCWDLILIEGWPGVFRISLSILFHCQDRLLEYTTFEEAANYLKEYPHTITSIQPILENYMRFSL